MAMVDRRRGDSKAVEAALAIARETRAFSLHDVNLEELPEELRSVRNLRQLDVRDCGLRRLPQWLGDLEALELINLDGNRIARLPESLAGLTSLRFLGLSQLSMRTWGESLRGLTALEVLKLAGTPVRVIPDWIGELRGLRILDLGGCGVVRVPAGVAQLTRLTHLYLWGHALDEFPEAVRPLPRLELLELSAGGTASQSEEARRIRDDPDRMSGLVGSTSEAGRLTALPEWLTALPALRALYLGGQGLRGSLPRLPATLEELWLGSNAFESVPAAVLRQRRLEVLDLHDNRLAELPPELDRLGRLRYLDLRYNPLPLPPEVLASAMTPARILDFAARAEGPTRRLDEAKLLVVGEGSVGKTSLIKRLVSGTFDAHETKTEGIEVQRWNVDAGGSEIQLNIWDFGGQEIMHATHQFFLTKRSLYVLVIDARQGEEQNRIEYWLKLIHSFGGDSPILIVGNKTEQSALDVDQRGLMAKYPNVIDIVAISCSTGTGFEELRVRLAEAIERMPHVRDELPEPYFDVKRELEQLDADYLTYPAYEAVCARHGVDTATARESLVEFLHDLGTVLCFRDDPRLSDTNILNPEWVTGGVYALLNSHLASQQKGLLRWNDVDMILAVAAFPPERRTFIVDVMKRFELCYESDGTFLVPDLLTKQEPDTGSWDDALVFEIGYDVLPSSILSRLIVRMHRMISKATVWRTGLVLSLDGNRALVKGDREDAVIRIAVDGSPRGRRGLLTAIRSELRAIGETIPGLTGEERVPVPDSPGVFIPYAHLLELEHAGHETVVPQGGEVKELQVRELLAGVELSSARAFERGTSRTVLERDGEVSEPADAPAWSPTESLRLMRWLLAGLVALVAVFVGAALLVGPAAAAGITGAALFATIAVSAVVLRLSGRLSEQGFLEAVREVLARAPGGDRT